MNLLITIDANYINPCKVMLYSLFVNNLTITNVSVYLIHSNLSHEKLDELQRYCAYFNTKLIPIKADSSMFDNAPTSKRYPKEMYYRLLSPIILPKDIDRILYLDPDILIVNPLNTLWNMNLCGKAFAAAAHTGMTDMINGINFARLDIDHEYFNTGVMLIDLNEARIIVRMDDIFECISKHEKTLILPDQDVFNMLYGSQTLSIDDVIWNYDVRNYSKYMIRSKGKHDLSWVIENTVILHFCGKKKPWNKDYKNPFALLYQHYMNLSNRNIIVNNIK